MQKYGVDESSSTKEKRGGNVPETQCPWCGKKVRLHGQVRLCPEHGSKPFEQP